MVYFNFSCVIRLLVEDRLEGEVEGVGRGQGGQLQAGIQVAVVGVWGQGRSSSGAGKGWIQGLFWRYCECVSSWNGDEVERKGGVQAIPGVGAAFGAITAFSGQ